ncbi:MAG: hypothetical protein ACREMV_12030 [Gemmatimonadales bacterium]
MSGEHTEKLRALLRAYADRAAGAPPPSKTVQSEAARKREIYADCLRNVVRPVLEAFSAELQAAGHQAATRDDTDRDDAYPSVALSFTPRAHDRSPETALASALMFKYDPRRGIVVQRDVKTSPARGRNATSSGDRLGTIGVETVSAEWVETKTLSFVDDVLKAN